jgi:signal transduction histidine kinase
MKSREVLAGIWRDGRPARPGRRKGTADGAGPETIAAQAAGSGTGAHTGGQAKRTPRPPRRLSLSNWPVSTRLVAVFIAASATGLVFGGLRVADAVGTANGYARATQLAVLGKQVTLLEQDLGNERDLTVAAAALTMLQQDAATDTAGPAVIVSLRQALAAAEGRLGDARHVTNAAAAPVRQLALAVGSDSAFPVSIQDRAHSVGAVVGDGGLGAVRFEAVGQAPTVIIDDYAGTLADLLALNAQLSDSSGDAVLSNEVSALAALSQAEDQAAQQRAILDAAFIESGGSDAGGAAPTKADPTGAPYNNLSGFAAIDYVGGLQALVTAQDLQVTYLQTFQESATPAESQAYLAATADPRIEAAQTIYNVVTAANGDLRAIYPQISNLLPGFTPTTAPTFWYADESAVVGAMRTVENQLTTEIVARSQVLQHQAFESALVTALVTAVVILLVLGMTALIGHTLVNPLRRLQADALEIAAVRLPARVAAAAADTQTAEGAPMVEPIGVQSTDEIGRVARAFDQVHAEAVRLAANEAQLRGSLNAMFISLSRRSVPLIERLARTIDGMEQNENDPDRLAELFFMDHLVTRMRRNSENLLVLAGEEPVRKWTDSVPLSDITRAAVAEIEQYSRVTLAVQPGITVPGQAAADIVHLLAELIENATLFSPQTTAVRVTVMELSSGGVLIEVRDDGVGVSPLRLTDMNWRLDHPPEVDVSISRHMGLFAVSRLAARHRIRVKLRPGTPQGLSALVWLPGNLAKREEVSALGGHWRPPGTDAANPAASSPPATTAGDEAGRHRSALPAANGEPPLVPEPTGRSARPATAWFAAKRPSTGAARSPEELAANWQSTTQGWATAGDAGLSQAGGQDPAGESAAPESPGRTSSGLPRRVPRTSAYPGAGTPASGLPAAPLTPAAAGLVLGAPPGEMAPQGGSYADAPHQGQLPVRRRSPEAVRSRVSGFQLGSRDAAQAAQATVIPPPAEEENSR